MTCPLCGEGTTSCTCTLRDLLTWADRQATLPGVALTARETAAAWLAARGTKRGPDPRQRGLFGNPWGVTGG